MKPVCKHLTIFLGMAMLSSAAFATGSQYGAVRSIVVRASDGLVYFYLDGAITGRPGCSEQPYWMIKDENSPAGKRQLAVLMAAKISGQPVSVVGTGACTRWSNGEDVDVIVL